VQQVRGRVVVRGGIIDDGLVVVERERIRYVGPAAQFDAGPDVVGAAPSGVPGDGYVLPGLVDLHNHGGGGASFNDRAASSARAAARHHHSRGTTSLLASVVTDEHAAMVEAISRAADGVDEGELLGIHVEGPFLSAGRCGAQDPRWLRRPDAAAARDLVAAGRGHVRVMTVAPELDDTDLVADVLLDNGVVPAVGHTEADAALMRRTLLQIRESRGRPALVTHLFNAMPPLHHRAPGAVAGALSAAARGDAVVELIADGVHLADETVRMVFDLLGPEGVVLVTDAMAAAGMPDGCYDLGPQRVRVRGGVARIDSFGGTGAPIAGGAAHLIDVVRRCVHAGVALEHALHAATLSPARALGVKLDGLVADGAADLVVTDGDLWPLRVMRAGAWIS